MTHGAPRAARWTAAEDAAIVALYPAGGLLGCINARVLRGRTPDAIEKRVRFLRVYRDLDKHRFDHLPLARALGETVTRMDVVPGARLIKRLA